MSRRKQDVMSALLTTKDIRECTTFKEAFDVYMRMSGHTYNSLSEEMHYAGMHICSVVVGRNPITLGFAKQLHKVTKLPTKFWIDLWLDSYLQD